ncbi:hypothetical protein BU23DRAFT_567683 [Bimuria novae-zelandiae CBS 107.79]|uniref:Uncharacterized protein n=1 Tax=Bimuria novae-zelandiae CBS 107.79 TaxID=1447943 RepID=A0A6A5VGG8_9PLEO|nr:hypothetical protein BU23DRAFT_567683 [Bimuria novae-zelandiae CBS 107.79]
MATACRNALKAELKEINRSKRECSKAKIDVRREHELELKGQDVNCKTEAEIHTTNAGMQAPLQLEGLTTLRPSRITCDAPAEAIDLQRPSSGFNEHLFWAEPSFYTQYRTSLKALRQLKLKKGFQVCFVIPRWGGNATRIVLQVLRPIYLELKSEGVVVRIEGYLPTTWAAVRCGDLSYMYDTYEEWAVEEAK